MNYPNWIRQFLFGKKYRILKHFLFWLFIYADEFLSIFGLTAPLETPYTDLLLEIPLDMLMVYGNIYFLLPRLFLKGKEMSYFLLTLVSVILVSFINFQYYNSNCDDCDLLTYIASGIVLNTGLVFIAVAMKLLEEFYRSSTQIQQLEADNLKTELAYLKNQVNPHFLFNTLNNMYVMAQGNSMKLPDTIMQLSDLLRYQLYETKEDTVLLKNELAYLENYLNLEKIRREDLEVVYKVSGDINNKSIRPLILLPFVENAFKFSNTGSGSDFINIDIEGRDKSVHVVIENNKGSLHQLNQGGIGLTNARRRLELGYPDMHTLQIEENENTFKATINLQVS